MSPDRLIYIADQIGTFFKSQGDDKAVPGIAACSKVLGSEDAHRSWPTSTREGRDWIRT